MQAIFERFGSHNCDLGTDKAVVHSYGDLYDSLFSPLRESAREVLEIGVASGASLCALAEFFPNARVTGVDIDTKRVTHRHERVRVLQLDGTDERSVDALGVVTYDLVLDDASHLPDHQARTLEIYGGRLAPGGLLVVEDIDGAHADALRPRLERLAAAAGLAMEWHDLREAKGRYDDIVAVFRAPRPAKVL